MEDLSKLMKAVSHPERLQIANLIHDHSELNGSQLQTFTGIQQAVVSQHVLKMQDLGFLVSRRSGSKVYYKLSHHGNKLFTCIKSVL